jgi:hypothetical protein
MFDGKCKGAKAVVGAVVLVGLVIATTPEAALARRKPV